MIPERLGLRNFLSYGDAETVLDFTALGPLACLSGENGTGKSALLDALTWVLWERSRSDGNEQLLHQGAPSMEVRLEFAHAGEQYQLIRQYERPTRPRASGKGALALAIRSGDRWRTISGNSVRETQRLVVDLIRTDYDLFLNSSYLAQGRASEFSRKSPGERKALLAELLSLAVYDELAVEAKARARDAQVRIDGDRVRLELLDAQLARADEHAAARDDAATRIVAAEEALGRLDETAAALRQAAAARVALDEARRELDERADRLAAEGRRLAAERAQAEGQRVAALAVVGRRAAILAAAARHAALVTAAPERAAVLTADARDRAALDALRERAEHGRRRWERDHQQASARLAELDRQLPAPPDPARLAAAEERVRTLHDARARAAEERAAAERRLAALDAEIKAQTQEGIGFRGQVERLSDAADCPLCHAALDDTRRAEAIAAGERDLAASRARLRETQHAARAVREALAATDRSPVAAAADPVAAAERDLQRAREGEVRAGERVAQHARERAAALQRLAELEATERRFEEYEQHEERALALGAALAAHETAVAASRREEAELRALGEAPLDARRLEEADDRLRDADERLARVAAAHVAHTEEETRLALRRRTLPGEADDRDPAGRLRALEAEAEAGRGRLRQLLGAHAAAETALGALVRYRSEREATASALATVAAQRQRWLDLVGHLGKKGVQALLIETALPAIERDANEVLGELSDGRMRLRFRTQRDQRSGKVEETLAIEIADEGGVRPYELYSGGEEFRIDFAIRVALAKTLARRAGAEVSLFVIDEGFGSQDPGNLERLVTAIQSASHQFRQVIVVTHLAELKDQFPVRIDVTKDARGSGLRITPIE